MQPLNPRVLLQPGEGSYRLFSEVEPRPNNPAAREMQGP